jgi:hypothetical protein
VLGCVSPSSESVTVTNADSVVGIRIAAGTYASGYPERGRVMTSNRELRVGDRVQHALSRCKGTIIEIDGNTILVRWTHRPVDDTLEEAADLILI